MIVDPLSELPVNVMDTLDTLGVPTRFVGDVGVPTIVVTVGEAGPVPTLFTGAI